MPSTWSTTTLENWRHCWPYSIAKIR